MLLTNLPKARLAHTPTPLEPMEALARLLDAKPRLFVKRDDCTGLYFGGNKARKLEYIMGRALSEKADVVIANGGVQSNFVRQTAAASAKLGFEFHGVVANPLSGTDYAASPVYNATGNYLLDGIAGAHMHQVDEEGPLTDGKVAELVNEMKAKGKTPFVAPFGASDGVGAMGYAECALELLAQFSEMDLRPSHIVLGTGSAGTHAGLLAGLRYAGSDITVLGVSVSEPADVKCERVRVIIEDMTPHWAGEVPVVSDDDIRVTDQYVGAGYAVPSDAGTAAIRTAAQTEGLALDPVYTGKVMAGFLDMVVHGELANGEDIVFLHTGGAPALFAYPEQFAIKEG